MIKAVVFDMFETLVTLFTGRTYFGEDHVFYAEKEQTAKTESEKPE